MLSSLSAFDFANMINANEHPSHALEAMSPFITQVHIKDALIMPQDNGLGHQACVSGQGICRQQGVAHQTNLPGDEQPQVVAYGLKKKWIRHAPAFRFADEGDNP